MMRFVTPKVTIVHSDPGSGIKLRFEDGLEVILHHEAARELVSSLEDELWTIDQYEALSVAESKPVTCDGTMCDMGLSCDCIGYTL